MSSDLWAAFGSPQGSADAQGSDKAPTEKEIGETWESDSWSAINEELEKAWSNSESQDPFARQTVARHTINPPASVPSARVEEEDDFGDFEEPEIGSMSPVTSHPPTSSIVPQAGVASLAEDQEDFGDFAEADPATPQEPFPGDENGNLVALKSAPADLGTLGPPESSAPNFDTLIDFGESSLIETNVVRPNNTLEGGLKLPPAKETPILQAESDSENDEDWDELGPGASKSISAGIRQDKKASAKLQKGVTKQSESTMGGQKRPPATLTLPPPSNIPPPSVLMYVICGLLPELPERIRITIVETWEENEADVRRHTDALQAAARILAGRKLRWKRDTILAQSMRMGMSGRQGGMKLAGIDRAEAQREDREAAELVRIWRKHVGSIRTALAEASATKPKPKPLPAVAESPVVRTVGAEEGGITAPRCCVLCGLKRNERVEKVDREVWDQFGEWWTEHWGHSACKAFWDDNEPRLRQR